MGTRPLWRVRSNRLDDRVGRNADVRAQGSQLLIPTPSGHRIGRVV